MPVSKKPRRKATPRPPRPKTAATGGGLPDRRAMESHLAAMADRSRDDAIARAQAVIYEAWERTTSRSRIALAHKALAISPLCADAYNLLAEEAGSVQQARDFYRKGIEAGELALGAEGFEAYAGQFWSFLETRPYMRARAGFAITLLKLGEEDAAIGHFRAMLELNPNDNQGIRYLLLGCLLRRDDGAAVKSLLTAYEDEGSAYWLYTRALLAFREGRAAEPQATRLVQDAWSANQHVPAILAGTRSPVAPDSGYITMGGADEATDYVRECGPAWHQTPGAVAWLNTLVAALPKSPNRPELPTDPR
jgi:tetratricopeptide (TPR) repeat protein